MKLEELHQAIIDQNSAQALKAVKSLSPLRTNVNNPTLFSYGMTTLQLAAMYGMLEVILELLLAGGDINQVGLAGDSLKSPLYLTLEHGHSFLANVLVALGANVRSVSLQANIIDDANIGIFLGTIGLDKNLLFSLAIWAVSNNNLDMFKVININLINTPTAKVYLQALFELAAFYGFANLTKHISMLTKPRHVISIRTPAYWMIKKALKEKQTTLDLAAIAHLTPTLKDWIVTLHQLHLDEPAVFYSVFEKLDLSTKKAFLEDKDIAYEVKNFASNAAAKADKKMLEMICLDVTTFNDLTKEALQQGNFVAFMTLDLDLFQPELSIWLREKKISLLTHYFINKKPNLFDAALKFSETAQLLDFLEIFWSIEGARKALIRRGIKFNAKLTEPMQKMAAQLLEHDIQSFANDVTQLIGNQAGITFQSVTHVPTPTTYELVLHDAMDPKLFSNLRIRFNRFNISIRHAFIQQKSAKLQELPVEIWQGIVSFLGKNDRKTVFLLSASIYNFMLSAKPMDSLAIIREKIRPVELIIEKYQLVHDLLIEDAKRNQTICSTVTLTIGLIFIAATAIMIYYTDQYGRVADAQEEQFFHAAVPPSNHTTCEDMSRYKKQMYASCNYDTLVEFCKDICKHFRSASNSEVDLIVGDIFTGIIALMIFGSGIGIFCGAEQGFASSAALSDKSLAKIKEEKIDVDLQKDFGTSHDGPSYDSEKLARYIKAKESELIKLKKLLPPEEKVVIEIKDEDEKEEKKVPPGNFPFWNQQGYAQALSLDDDEEKEEIFDPMHPLLG